ncbi:MAG: hypothetical protein ACPIOQ_38580, partial [Promethearchaeia archaeon]
MAGIVPGKYVQIDDEIMLLGAESGEATPESGYSSRFGVTRGLACTAAGVHEHGATIQALDITVLNLGHDLSATATTLKLADTNVRNLKAGSFLVMDAEIMHVTLVMYGTKSVFVARGVGGSKASSHADGCKVSILGTLLLAGDADGIGAIGSSLKLFADDSMPVEAGMYLQVQDEIVRVLTAVRVRTNAADYDDLTVERAQFGTLGAEHAFGSQFLILSRTSLSSTMTASDTICDLNSVPQAGVKAGSYIQIHSEIMQVTAISGNRANVSRGLASTTPDTHALASTVRVLRITLLTSADIDELETSISVVNVSSIRLVAGSYLKIEHEVMRVESMPVGGTALRVKRGAVFSSAAPHKSSLPVHPVPTTQINLLYDGLLDQERSSFPVKSAISISVTADSYIMIADECMKVVAVDGNTLSVLRAQVGTSAQVHPEGSVVVLVEAAKVMAPSLLTVQRGQANTSAAVHSDLASVTTVLPIYDEFASNSQMVFGGGGAWTRRRGSLVL